MPYNEITFYFSHTSLIINHFILVWMRKNKCARKDEYRYPAINVLIFLKRLYTAQLNND